MRILQINLNDWLRNEKGNPISLLELPLSVLNIEDLSGLSFCEYQEDGLGICYSCFVRIDDQEAHLKGFMAKDSKKVGVIIEMHSNETCPDCLIRKICKLFNAEINGLRWINQIVSQRGNMR